MTLEEKDVVIVYEPSRSSLPSPLSFDRRRLQQVVLNLLTNAVKFTTQGGAIKIKQAIGHRRSTKNEVTLKVSVEDNGVGMEQEDADRVFDPSH